MARRCTEALALAAGALGLSACVVGGGDGKTTAGSPPPPMPQTYCTSPAPPVGAGLARSASLSQAGIVHWSGWLSAPTSGEYTFHVPDSRARVTVQHQVVVVDGRAASTISLDAARFHAIRVEVPEGSAPPILEWSPPGAERQAVPVTRLHAPLATASAQRGPAP